MSTEAIVAAPEALVSLQLAANKSQSDAMPEGSPSSTAEKLTNKYSPVSEQTILPPVQKIDQFEFDAPDWKDAAQLKSAWATNQRELADAATASMDKQAEVYICLAKARAILSQRGDNTPR
jgi:hypothetical protein